MAFEDIGMTKHLTDAINEFIGKLPPKQHAASPAGKQIEADWLLVTCIDCRYHHIAHEFMHKHHPMQSYD